MVWLVGRGVYREYVRGLLRQIQLLQGNTTLPAVALPCRAQSLVRHFANYVKQHCGFVPDVPTS